MYGNVNITVGGGKNSPVKKEENLEAKPENSEIKTNQSRVLREIWEKIYELMYNRSKTKGRHWIKNELCPKRDCTGMGNDEKLTSLIKNATELHELLIRNNLRGWGSL